MSRPGGARLPEGWRMRLRIVAILFAYVIYRLPGFERFEAGLLLGIGSLLLMLEAIDHLTLARRVQPPLMLLGIALILLGLVLAVR